MPHTNEEMRELMEFMDKEFRNVERWKYETYSESFIKWHKNKISDLKKSIREEIVNDVIKMADKLESDCNLNGDKGVEQWKNFKWFRNTIRDKYL